MNIYDLIVRRRTVRRFKEVPIGAELLQRCVNAARLAPSASNLQPLEYIVVTDDELLPTMYDSVHWAGYLRPHGDPPEGHRPTAYIVILKNNKISTSTFSVYDIGEAVENIILVAEAEGLGSCQFGSVEREKVREMFKIPPHYEIPLVIALGYPDEKHSVDPYTDSPKYWRDEKGVHHVPKRSVEEVLHWNGFLVGKSESPNGNR